MDAPMFLMILIAAAVTSVFCGTTSRDATEEDFINLYDSLLANYKRHVRPIANQSAALNVLFDFSLLAIEGIDDVNQHVSILAVLFIGWTDKNLMWDSDDYGGIDRLYLDQSKIWTPDVYVRHSPYNDASLNSLPTRHTVFSNGNVVFESSGAINTACGLEMTYFPFDSHACVVRFGILDSSTKDVVLEVGMAGFTGDYIENEEWTVDALSMEEVAAGRPDTEFSTMKITIEVTRRPVYYIVNVILPAVILGILSLLTFIVSAESGERLSYTLSILLSLSVYIPYIGDLIPTSSVHMPVVLRYLIPLFLMNAMCVVMSTVIIAIRWSDVVDKNDVQKTILIFGIPITIKKRSGDRSFGFWGNFESKDTCLSKDTGVECTHVVEDKAHEIKKQSHPPGTEINSAKNEQGPKQIQVKEEESSTVCKFTGRNYVDPDVMAISDLVSRYSFLALILSFFIMTAVTFVQLYCQNF